MFALFNAIDHLCAFMPDAVRLGLYGLLVGILAMLIYRWISPQKRLAAVKLEMADARRAMQAYKGTDTREMLRLSAASIRPALRQLLLVIGPTLIAMAPVVLVVLWLEATYSNRLPSSGDLVTATVSPPDSVNWAPNEVVTETQPNGRYVIRWPRQDAPVKLVDARSGVEILRLPLDRPMHSITQVRWWHRVLDGGKLIGLPAGTSISSVELDLPSRQVWSIGPSWLRTWHTPFMIALTIAALGMKLR